MPIIQRVSCTSWAKCPFNSPGTLLSTNSKIYQQSTSDYLRQPTLCYLLTLSSLEVALAMFIFEFMILLQYCLSLVASLSSSNNPTISLQYFMPLLPKSQEALILSSLGTPFAPSKATLRLNWSLITSDTSTNMRWHVPGKALGFNSFKRGSSNSLLFSSIDTLRSPDFSSKPRALQSLDCPNRISTCSETQPSSTKYSMDFLN